MTNVLIIGFGTADGFTARRLRCLKETLNLGNIYIVCAETEEYRDVAIQTINLWDALNARYERYPIDERPLDDRRLNEIAPYAMEILLIMQRMRHHEMYENAKDFYLRHLRYWSSFLEEKEIGLMINHSVPHEVYDHIIYRLCKARGIVTCMGDQLNEYQGEIKNARVYQRELTYQDPRLIDLNKKIREQYDGCLNIPLGEEAEKRFELLSDYADHFENRTNRAPISVKRKFFLNHYYSAAGRPLKSFVSKTVGIIRTKWLLSHYNKYAIYPPEGEKYVYVPLHFTPECNCCPQGGGLYADQAVMVDILARSVPEGVLIYVKENPGQIAYGRSRSVYDRMMECSNVRLIREDTNQMALIRNSIAVAALTGTAGYECQYAGIPFLMFGYFVSRYAPGTICVRSAEECRNAVISILNGNYPKWDRNDIRKYLRFVEEIAIREKTCTDEEFAKYIKHVAFWNEEE